MLYVEHGGIGEFPELDAESLHQFCLPGLGVHHGVSVAVYLLLKPCVGSVLEWPQSDCEGISG